MSTFDTNKSYCYRLAQVTFFQIAQEKASIAAPVGADIPHGACPPAGSRSHATRLDQRLSDFLTPGTKQLHACLRNVDALAAELEGRPDVQSRLTPITEYTVSKWLLERELEASCFWSRTADAQGQYPDAYEAARRRKATGLCLSGGGIRSATFSLGVVQALSRLGVLGRLDYLSSVSGGGYMHQFLANWIHTTGSATAVEALLDPIPRNTEAHVHRASVQPEPLRWLRRFSNYLAPRKGLLTLDTLTIGATWLRNTGLNLLILLSSIYCILLLPHLGTLPYAHFSDKPWLLHISIAGATVFAVYLLALLWRAMKGLRRDEPGVRPGHDKQDQRMSDLMLASASLLVAAVLLAPFVYRSVVPGGTMDSPIAHQIFEPPTQPESIHYKGDFERTSPGAESVQVTVDTLADRPRSALATHWVDRPTPLWRYIRNGSGWPIAGYGVYCAALLFLLLRQSLASKLVWALLFLIGLFSSYLLLEGIRLLFFVLCFAVPYDLISALAVAALPPLLFSVPFLLLEETLGLLGYLTNSSQREWLARWRALSLMFGGGWFAIILFSLFGPWTFHTLAGYAKTSYTVWAAWLATTLAGVFSARNNKTSQPQESSSTNGSMLLEALALVAPPLFVVGLLVLLSTFVSWSLKVQPGTTFDPHENVHRALFLFLVSFALAALFGVRVDINAFSMHAFYRDRIARCYAGATNPVRDPNPFTGMARSDRALKVHELLPRGYHPLDEANTVPATYAGPFPIFCTAINLTTGEDLAYQERKAASFIFTPLFSGYSVGWTAASTALNQLNGFVDTRTYVHDDPAVTRAMQPAPPPNAKKNAATKPLAAPAANRTEQDDASDETKKAEKAANQPVNDSISVATASAVSGAAASPNMGYHSNAASAFLLTVFNVRLGWWLRNPRRRQIGGKTPYTDDQGQPTGMHVRSWRTLWTRVLPPQLGNMPSSPRVGFFSLFKELFGHSDDTTPYVYLTDGGHFDNMGLYELLRRRCHTIIVCDAEADASLHFEGIGMAIRKARLDFGVEVTLDCTGWTEPPHPGHDAANKTASVTDNAQPSDVALKERSDELPYVLSAHLSTTDPATLTGTLSRRNPPPVTEGISSFREFPANSIHCVHGTIRYPEDEHKSQFGQILYIKASLTGDEPPDILNYRMQHPAFPHDTTLNQFFTESQFESYRRLGEHIVLQDAVIRAWLAYYLKAPAMPPP